MRKSYDFSKAIKNPYAKRLQNQASASPITMNQGENRIAIGMSCANCSGIDTTKIYEFIATKGRGYDAYALRPESGTLAASVDFYLILESAASVASIAGLLWMAYDRLIAPKKRDPKDDAGINIAIIGPDVVSIWLGKDVLTEDEFAKRFELMVQNAQDQEWQVAHKATIERIQDPRSWIRVSGPKRRKADSAHKRTRRGREYQR